MTSERPSPAGVDDGGEDRPAPFSREMVLDQLGGWRGMVDASLPTVAFIVANSIGGLRVGIWAAVVAAVLVFLLRLVRRQSIQQAVSGLFAVAVAVFIAARSGEARDFFVLGLIRNAGIAVVLLGSVLVRRPLVGVIAEFLAPSHLGGMTGHRLPSWRRRRAEPERAAPATGGSTAPAPAPERHWRQDPRMLRAYTWLTVLWAGTFVLRAAVTGTFYAQNEVGLLGTSSIVLGLPLTGAALLVTLWVVARLHRHRAPAPAPGREPAGD